MNPAPIILSGCAPVPLAHYLKALGVLRLVAEQADPATPRHAWPRPAGLSMAGTCGSWVEKIYDPRNTAIGIRDTAQANSGRGEAGCGPCGRWSNIQSNFRPEPFFKQTGKGLLNIMASGKSGG